LIDFKGKHFLSKLIWSKVFNYTMKTLKLQEWLGQKFAPTVILT